MRAEISINNDVSKQWIYVGKDVHRPLDMEKLCFSHRSRTIRSKDEFQKFCQSIDCNLKNCLTDNDAFWDLALIYNAYAVVSDKTVSIFFGNWIAYSLMSNIEKDSGKIIPQDGACLLYSIGENGQIVTILYPAKTPVWHMKEENIILRVGFYSCLELLSFLRKDLKDLVMYQHVSTVDTKEGFFEKWRYRWLVATRMVKIPGKDYENSADTVRKAILKYSLNQLVLASLKPVGLVLFALFCLLFGLNWILSLLRLN
jgi:hypothetical protein